MSSTFQGEPFATIGEWKCAFKAYVEFLDFL